MPEPFTVSSTEAPAQQTGSNPSCTRHFWISTAKVVFSLSFCIEKKYFSSSYATVCLQSLCFTVHKSAPVYFFPFIKRVSAPCLQGMLEYHFLSLACGSFWGLPFVPLDLSPLCATPRLPGDHLSSRAGGSTLWQHTPVSCILPEAGSAGLTLFLSRKPHRALRSTLILITMMRIWPIKMSFIWANVPQCFTCIHTHPSHKHHLLSLQTLVLHLSYVCSSATLRLPKVRDLIFFEASQTIIALCK